ncbi:MAG: GNAT family N-acetyltransferase [Actinomycetota bacterium]|nr:GNAT family N-acetyltransferase [Actinomycetota bacterium]
MRSVAPADHVQITTSVPREQWEQIHARDPCALIAQAPAWIDCLTASSYSGATRMYESASGWRAVLPMVRRASPWPRTIAPQLSMPNAWGMGGLICESPPSSSELEAVAADLRSLTAISTRIRPNPLRADQWTGLRGPRVVTIPRLAHVIDLDGGASGVWGRMAKKARQGVRRGERSALEIECDSSGRLVPVFYDLLMLSVERWAAHQHEPPALARWRARRRDPLEKFQRLAAELGDAMRVWVAWKDGEPAAAMVVLIGANASDTRGAMNKDLAAPTNANDILQWRAIEDACEAGCRHYHLGESGQSRSLANFKEKFTAYPVPYAEYVIERASITKADAAARGAVKRALRFRDV